MIVFVTGITGFIGSNLSKYLGEIFTLIGVSRTEGSECVDYNGLNVESLNYSSAFIHLAGKAHDVKNIAEKSEYFQVNTELTKKLFDIFLESKCSTFIFISSVKAVADKVEIVLTENHEPAPMTVYGESKLEAENYIMGQSLPKGKRVYILRPCMVHGVKNKGNLNLLYKFVEKGFPYPFGAFDNQRSFLSVENLCFVINELLLNKNIPSGIYNVADDKPLSTKSVIEIIGKSTKKKIKIVNVPKFIIKMIAAVGNLLPILINSEKVEKLTQNFIVSNSKIKKAIKKDLPLNSVQGLTKTINSFNN